MPWPSLRTEYLWKRSCIDISVETAASEFHNSSKNSQKPPLFGGPLLNAHRQFLDPPIMSLRWPIFVENRRFAPVFDGNWPTEAHDGRNQKLTVHTPPNNENDFKKFYRSFETVKSMNFMHCSAYITIEIQFSFTENDSQLRQIRSLQYEQLRQFWKKLRSQNDFLYTITMQWQPNLVKNATFQPRKKFRGAPAVNNYR